MDLPNCIRRALHSFVLPALLLVPVASQAATLTYGLDFEFSGADMPGGTAPWITATFDDSFGGANTVRLTMSANNLVGDESVANWHFNFDPALDPLQLTITDVDVSAVGATVVDTGVDQFKADGDGLYDILFDFPPPPGDMASRFTTGETVIYDLTYISPIDVSSFDFLSAPDGGAGEFFTAAQIQSIGPGGNGSGWIGFVPEPATGSLLALGLVGLAARRGARR